VLEQIPDDPIISSIMRTGWPPWLSESEVDYCLDEWEEDEEDFDEDPS